MSELRGLKFVTTIVLVLKTINGTFYSDSKAKQLLLKVTLMMYFNESIILQLYER